MPQKCFFLIWNIAKMMQWLQQLCELSLLSPPSHLYYLTLCLFLSDPVFFVLEEEGWGGSLFYLRGTILVMAFAAVHTGTASLPQYPEHYLLV